MTMKSIIALALYLITYDAMAQPVETVTVTGGTLAGVWKITRPNYVAKTGFFAPLKWGPMHGSFCRIEQVQRDDLTIQCFGGGDGIFKTGTVTFGDGHIHLAWGSMLARIIVDGTLQSPTQFTGTYTGKLSGINFDDPEPSVGTKLAITPEASDTDAKSVLLRNILTSGTNAVPHDDTAIKKNTPGYAGVPQLGALQAISYLGEVPREFPSPAAKRPLPDFTFSVYAVEFDSGERICGLHQRSDSVLDGFLCI